MRTATETTLRHVAMLTAIPAPPHRKSTRQIMEALRDKDPNFAVSVRSVQRSLESLSRIFPIASDTRGRTNYWSWLDPDALTQIPAMTAPTAFVLRLAAEYLKSIMPPATLRVLDPYFKHADRILRGTELGSWKDRAAIITPGPALIPPPIPADVQETVYEALRTDRKIEVLYRGKYDEKPRPMLLSPQAIVVRTGIVYLLATAWDYEDVRHYVLHRMSEPRLIEEPARRLRDFRLEAHLASDGAFAYPDSADKLRLRALFDSAAGAHLTESRLSEDHRATETDDGKVLVEATVDDTSELRWWLRRFGSLVEVLEPASLREEFAAEAWRLAGMYESGGRAEGRETGAS